MKWYKKAAKGNTIKDVQEALASMIMRTTDVKKLNAVADALGLKGELHIADEDINKEAKPTRMSGAQLATALDDMHGELSTIAVRVPLEIINPWGDKVKDSIEHMLELLKGIKNDMGL